VATIRDADWRPGLGILLATLLGAVLLPAAHADPLYVRQAEAAKPTPKQEAEALKQVREHKDVEVRDTLKVPPFHKRLDPPVTKGETFCQGCHGPLPHSEKLRTRSFLNMHSRFVACETCHFRPDLGALDYRWLDYGSGQAAPPANRFRTGLKTDNGVALDGRVKIAPFHQGAPAVALPRTAFDERVAADWKAADENGKARLKARLHAPLEKEGPACGRCHGEDRPLLDLAALGAPPEQAAAIRRHVIPQFFGRYQKEDERLKIIDILR
jgi:RNase P subunit RPR2